MNQVNNDKKVLQVCSVDKSWTEIHSEKHLGLFLQGVLKGRKIIFYHDKNPQCSTYWSERLKWLQIQRSPSHFQHSHNMKLHNTNLKQTDPNIHSRIKWGETSVCIRWNEHQNSNCFSGSFYSKSSSNKQSHQLTKASQVMIEKFRHFASPGFLRQYFLSFKTKQKMFCKIYNPAFVETNQHYKTFNRLINPFRNSFYLLGSTVNLVPPPNMSFTWFTQGGSPQHKLRHTNGATIWKNLD